MYGIERLAEDTKSRAAFDWFCAQGKQRDWDIRSYLPQVNEGARQAAAKAEPPSGSAQFHPRCHYCPH